MNRPAQQLLLPDNPRQLLDDDLRIARRDLQPEQPDAVVHQPLQIDGTARS